MGKCRHKGKTIEHAAYDPTDPLSKLYVDILNNKSIEKGLIFKGWALDENGEVSGRKLAVRLGTHGTLSIDKNSTDADGRNTGEINVQEET